LLRPRIEGEAGFATGLALTEEELAAVRSEIESQWLARLRRCERPGTVDEIAPLGLARYHEVSHLVDHARIWPKAERIFSPEAVALVRRTSLVRALEAELGPFVISDEEGLGREEIYWRLVRPMQSADTGPLHADRWFWDLGHGQTPQGCQRLKVWVGVICEPGRSGLRLVPGSHLRDWRYHGELREGFMKPVIDEDVEALAPVLVETRPGQAVVFHDKLLHGGAMSRGQLTRVSFEFTMFVRP
jgi:hypothetical protein